MNRAMPLALLGLLLLGAGIAMQDTRQDTVRRCVDVSLEPGGGCDAWREHTVERDNTMKEPAVGPGSSS